MDLKCKKIFKFFIVIAILVSVYSAFIEPNLLVVKKYNLDEHGNRIETKSKEIEGKKGIKVVQITDTQIGYFYSEKRLGKITKRINSLEPDIVVFTGDLIDYATQKPDIEEIIKHLSNIEAKVGKFSVFGNHDYMYELPKYYKKIMDESGFDLLVNKNKKIEILENKNLNIIGLDDVFNGEQAIEKYDKEMDDNDFNLMLIHEPDIMDGFKEGKIDLAVAGHTHGGQVSLPIKGEILAPPYGKKYTKGFYEINENNLYVSSGLGSTKLPFRLMNIPEIIEFNIYF